MKFLLSGIFILAAGFAFAQNSILVNESSLPKDGISIKVETFDVAAQGDDDAAMITNPTIGPPPVPEPATLLALGAAGALFAARSRKRA